MPLTIPNLLTLSRVLLIPVVVTAYLHAYWGVAFGLLLYSMLTDYFDGVVARWFGQETAFGSVFDPMADKCFALAYYGLALWLGVGPLWFVVIILSRNFAQLWAIPILSWWLQKPFKVAPKPFAKWTTALSSIMVLYPLFFVEAVASHWSLEVGMALLLLVLGAMELRILVTYVPRLIAIALDTHETFE